MSIKAVQQIVSRKGTASLGWSLGHGYIQEDLTVKSKKWCITKDDKTIAECRSKAIAKEIASALSGAKVMTLDDELKAAGMLTVSELMAGQPLDGFVANTSVNDLTAFSEWLDMRSKEMLRMKARMTLDKKEGDDLYEWVLSHCAVLKEVRINFNIAIGK